MLNTENTDISIMSKMNTVGAGVRAGSILRRLMRQGGDGEDRGASDTGLLHGSTAMGL